MTICLTEAAPWRHRLHLILFTIMMAGVSVMPGMAKGEEVTLSRNGITLNANLELADGKSIGDGIILITHGTFAHNGMEIISSLQSLFKERALSTLAINLSLGIDNRHGNLDCARPMNHRHADAVDEIAAWVDWLGNKGADNILLVGHSRGGNQTAWYLAERNNERVRGGVLIAPATWDFKETAMAYQKAHKKQLPALLKDMENRISAGNGNKMIQDVALLYCPSATLTAETFVGYYQDNPLKDTPHALHLIHKPVMVIAASEDAVVPDLVEKMSKTPYPGVRFEIIKGAGHFFRDLYADDIADLTADFIKSLP